MRYYSCALCSTMLGASSYIHSVLGRSHCREEIWIYSNKNKLSLISMSAFKKCQWTSTGGEELRTNNLHQRTRIALCRQSFFLEMWIEPILDATWVGYNISVCFYCCWSVIRTLTSHRDRSHPVSRVFYEPHTALSGLGIREDLWGEYSGNWDTYHCCFF